MQEIPIDWGNALVAFVAELILVLLVVLFTPKAKVIWGISHGFTYRLTWPNQPDLRVQTQKVTVHNVGRAAASDVEVHLNFEPEHFNVWPTQNYETEKNPEDRFTIKFRSLGRNEHVSIEMLSTGDLEVPAVLSVRSPQGVAKMVAFAPLRVFPRAVNLTFVVLAAIGILAIFYMIVAVVSRALGT